MAVMYSQGEEYVELAVDIQIKDNTIAANQMSPNHFRMPPRT
jgi:hypothetical protein